MDPIDRMITEFVNPIREAMRPEEVGRYGGSETTEIDKTYLVKEGPHPSWGSGVQMLFRFPNGRGASVVQGPYSYGVDEGHWELAVIEFLSEDNHDFNLDYSTEITDDVEGHLTESDVNALLDRIKDLPKV